MYSSSLLEEEEPYKPPKKVRFSNIVTVYKDQQLVPNGDGYTFISEPILVPLQQIRLDKKKEAESTFSITAIFVLFLFLTFMFFTIVLLIRSILLMEMETQAKQSEAIFGVK